jgi:hypothetical protein
MEFFAMNSVRYMIAKHVPDVFRKEPRNIGIILWSEEGIEARFWAVDSYGFIDGRKIPDFVNSKSAYEQWIGFWTKELKKSQVEAIGSGKLVAVNSPEFVQAIQSGNSANFFLEDAGSILEPISKDQLPALADELFQTVVTAEAVDEPDTTTFINEKCERVIKTTKLSNNRHFYRRRGLHTTLSRTVVELIEFSYFYGNGAPQWLGQQVPLKRYKSQLMKEVDSVCWRFEKVIKSGFISQEQGAAFVCPSDEQAGDRDVLKAIEILGTATNVFDLRDPEPARREFDKVASLPIEH